MRSAGFSFSTVVAVVSLVTVIAAQQSPATKPATTTTTAKPATAVAKPAVSHPASPANVTAQSLMTAADANGLVKKYCVGCHNDRNKDRTASLTLSSFDFAQVGEHADVAERMIRKLQASMMPP